MNLLQYQHFYLVGIKGVAMTALAQMLTQAGKFVAGSDVAEDFVTKEQLAELPIQIDTDFNTELPTETDCVIYTAAHQGEYNQQVQAAQKKHIPTFSHAQALALLANSKKCLAVSGVGGKSTTSAMLSWMLVKTKQHPSYSVGVGSIPGLEATAHWDSQSKHCVVEADEYATNPTAIAKGASLIPRFHYYQPTVTICTNLKFDHPDVYKDFHHTQAEFLKFFTQTKKNGFFIFNSDDCVLQALADELKVERPDITCLGVGYGPNTQIQITKFESEQGKTRATIVFEDESIHLQLQLPGKHNIHNAALALSAIKVLTLDTQSSAETLASFASTARRFEFKGEKNGIRFYDDYAHHPHEIESTLEALFEWYNADQVLVTFQPHTFSRTKQLFSQFVNSFAAAHHIAMTEIFASAREAYDSTITTQKLCDAISEKFPHLTCINVKDNDRLVKYIKKQHTIKVVITMGAGDIYHVHEMIE